MARTHPHAEATYRIVTLPKEGAFGVEVVIPESLPTTVTEFATEAEAAAWIARHKTQVVEDASSGSPFQKKRRKLIVDIATGQVEDGKSPGAVEPNLSRGCRPSSGRGVLS